MTLWLFFIPAEQASADEITVQVSPNPSDTSTATIEVTAQTAVTNAQIAVTEAQTTLQTIDTQANVLSNPTPVDQAINAAQSSIDAVNQNIQTTQTAIENLNTAQNAVVAQEVVVQEVTSTVTQAQAAVASQTEAVETQTAVVADKQAVVESQTAVVESQTAVVQQDQINVMTAQTTLDNAIALPPSAMTYTTSGYVAPTTPESSTAVTTTLPAMWDAATQIQTPFDIKMGDKLFNGQGANSEIYVSSKATISFGGADFTYWDWPNMTQDGIYVFQSDYMSAGPGASITVTTTETTLSVDWILHRFGDTNGPLTNISWDMTVNPTTGEWTGVGTMSGNTSNLWGGPRTGVRQDNILTQVPVLDNAQKTQLIATATTNLTTAQTTLATDQSILADATQTLSQAQQNLTTANQNLQTSQQNLTTAQANLTTANQNLTTETQSLTNLQSNVQSAEISVSMAVSNLNTSVQAMQTNITAAQTAYTAEYNLEQQQKQAALNAIYSNPTPPPVVDPPTPPTDTPSDQEEPQVEEPTDPTPEEPVDETPTDTPDTTDTTDSTDDSNSDTTTEEPSTEDPATDNTDVEPQPEDPIDTPTEDTPSQPEPTVDPTPEHSQDNSTPGLEPNSPDQLSDTVVKEAPEEALVPHVQVDKPGIENGGIEFYGTKSQPQVVGEDGKLTPPPPPPGSGLPIPPDAITTTETFIGQPGGTTFNAPDIAVPVELTYVCTTAVLEDGTQVHIDLDGNKHPIEQCTFLPAALDAIPGAGEAIQAMGAAYAALANIGNDMSPITRKKAKKILVLTVAVAAIRRRFGS